MSDDHEIISQIKSYATNPADESEDGIVGSLATLPDGFRAEVLNKMKGWIAAEDGSSLRQRAQLGIWRGACLIFTTTSEKLDADMALAEIEVAKRRAQAEAWDKGEAAVAAQLLMNSQLPSPPTLDEETRQQLQPFVAWTTKTNVRYCPSKPWVVASFVLHQSATGASTATLLRQVEAIARLHDIHNLANPTATHTARAALAAAIPTDPPRSWTKAEKETFVQLPAEVRAAIARREQQREVELAAIKRQNQTAPVEKPVENESKGTNHHGEEARP